MPDATNREAEAAKGGPPSDRPPADAMRTATPASLNPSSSNPMYPVPTARLPAPAASAGDGGPAAMLPAAVQSHLGALLRDLLDEIAREPLPARLAALLEALDGAPDRMPDGARGGAAAPVPEPGGHGAALEPSLRAELLSALSPLRAYAVSLCGDRERADDLVQEAVARGLRNLDRFERGTNLQAWLFVILRNQFHSEWRRRTREVEDPDEVHARSLATAPDQMDRLAVGDLRAALARIPAEQREALLLVAAEGLTYEEAATACGCVVGTIKSRVSRARERLAGLLGVADGRDLGSDLGSDGVTRAVTG